MPVKLERPKPSASSSTPLMRQYEALKAKYPDAILFFRLGDFYEMFGEDARTASPILGVVLTSRQGMPMCGIPHHSSSGYVAKLLKAGHRVAIAEQMEDPLTAKGIVRRDVVRLVTPGTVMEDELLEPKTSNYLAAVILDTVGWGLACLEVSTGEFWATQALNDEGAKGLFAELARLQPAEVLVSPKDGSRPEFKANLGPRTTVTPYEPEEGDREGESQNRKDRPLQNHPLALRAAHLAGAYAARTQLAGSLSLSPEFRESGRELALDEAAIRTLELVDSAAGPRGPSLWRVLDLTRTPMGSRRLKDWILHPLTELAALQRRQNSVEELLDKRQAREALSRVLSGIADLERAAMRCQSRNASPRDLACLRDALKKAPELEAWLVSWDAASSLHTVGQDLKGALAATRGLCDVLEGALVTHPPARVSDGDLVRLGFSPELDELKALKSNSRQALERMEVEERRSTGIGSLKIGYTAVFGYFIEVTKPHLAKVPHHYHRKQTLVNAERFVTQSLKELESKILGAEGRILRLEASLFEELRQKTAEALNPLKDLCRSLSTLDALAALAEAAERGGYVKPVVDLTHDLEIEEGRHPLVEEALPPGSFVPNSLSMTPGGPRTLILTGANMSGKSTFLRQNALLVLMAQMGSFIPAKSARIGLVDRILTRIGAHDAVTRGESTFMVEMRETSHILRSATKRSLLILDEIGRGTSTYDGISIAWAVLEHLHEAGPRVLFATHYFELTELAKELPQAANFNVEAKEWTNAQGRREVVFLHRISPGPADRSYGIHVAELAGLPPKVLSRARAILEELERDSRTARIQKSGPGSQTETLPLFEEHPILQELKLLNPEAMTPLEALKLVSDLKKKTHEGRA